MHEWRPVLELCQHPSWKCWVGFQPPEGENALDSVHMYWREWAVEKGCYGPVYMQPGRYAAVPVVLSRATLPDAGTGSVHALFSKCAAGGPV